MVPRGERVPVPARERRRAAPGAEASVPARERRKAAPGAEAFVPARERRRVPRGVWAPVPARERRKAAPGAEAFVPARVLRRAPQDERAPVPARVCRRVHRAEPAADKRVRHNAARAEPGVRGGCGVLRGRSVGRLHIALLSRISALHIARGLPPRTGVICGGELRSAGGDVQYAADHPADAYHEQSDALIDVAGIE